MSTVVTGVVRLSYANLWEPRPVRGGEPKYSASLIIPKSDTESIKRIQQAIKEAKKAGIARFGERWGRIGLRDPLRDGDTERDDEAYADALFINASSTTQPGIVDRKVQPILDRSEVYSGCYAKALISLFPYNRDGNRGIGVGLEHIQKVRDGEPLDGRVRVDDAFTPLTDDNDNTDW